MSAIETKRIRTDHKNSLSFFWVVQLLLGAPLVISGLIHLSNPYQFLEAVLRYDVLYDEWASVFANMMIFLSMITGLALIFDLFPQGALAISVGMFTMFAVAQLSVLVRGINAMCGCFGSFSHEVSWYSFSTLVAMGICSIFLWFRRSKQSAGQEHDDN